MEAQEGDLSWLQDFIQAKFYVPCQCSPKFTTNFCCECKGLPFCEDCKNNTHTHDDHNVLRVCKASRQTATTVLMIKKLLDVSDIQTYSINGQRIVYISQRQSNEKHNPKVIGRKCEICGWSNLSSSVKFCSVECKVDWASKEEKTIRCIKQKNWSTPKPLEECYVAPSGSFRKRPRKGCPIRSPLV
ncbi:hypothetical protein KPL70_019652 [Citrus sinensis]|nr:uncharacterized protein LOC102621820 [Citrus sinensis]XP_024036703.1 uncharacterized protein LOC112096844 [Citrus x clementina]KAH9663337.1 hypothetical protein KPL70_019652 [Citrus sinensis]